MRDSIADARGALERGVAAGVVAHQFMPAAIRHRRIAALRELLREWNADDEFAAALDAALNRRPGR